MLYGADNEHEVRNSLDQVSRRWAQPMSGFSPHPAVPFEAQDCQVLLRFVAHLPERATGSGSPLC
jgi:hypothetical protein